MTLALPLYYLRWHYGRALADMIGIIGNFVWFFHEFFSVPLMLRTFFAPFHRLSDDRVMRHALDFEVMFERLVVSTIMRIVGMFMRLFLIIFYLVFELLTLAVGTVLFLAWFLAPLVLVGLFLAGLALLTT